MIDWIKEKIKWILISIGTIGIVFAGVVMTYDDISVGDKIKYVGDIPSAYGKIGWVITIEPKMADGIHDNDTPFMISFPLSEGEINHMEEVAKWRKVYNTNPSNYTSYGASHPYPTNLPKELQSGDLYNRVWASADQLEIINTSQEKKIKKDIEELMTIKLETGDIEELKKARDAIIPPKSNIEL